MPKNSPEYLALAARYSNLRGALEAQPWFKHDADPLSQLNKYTETFRQLERSHASAMILIERQAGDLGHHIGLNDLLMHELGCADGEEAADKAVELRQRVEIAEHRVAELEAAIDRCAGL